VQASLPQDHPLRALVELPARFASDVVGVGAVGSARLFDLHRRGTYRLDGGRQGLRSLLYERLKTHSGEVRPELKAQAISVKRGKVAGVVFAGHPEPFGCKHVLCGMGADRVVQMLDGDKPPKRLLEAAELRPAYHRYLLHLVAPLDALPDALGPYSFAVRDRSRPLEGANALAIHLADGYGQHAVLSVEALAPDPSPAALARLRSEVLSHLDALFPFVERHLLLIHSPHDGVAPERADVADKPSPSTPDPVWEMARERALGICGIPHSTGIKHLHLASRQVLPGLGLEGELHTGWGAARLVLQTERKRDLVKGAVLEGG
jgi:hypothetical protein